MLKKVVLPIVVFAYNRPDHLRKTLHSLSKAHLANKSELYIFVDGPKNNDDVILNNQIRQVISELDGFKKINTVFRETNIGLAQNIITSVTEIMNTVGEPIVFEDDMIVNENCLLFLNDAFDKYKEFEKVSTITAYSPPIDFQNYEDDVFLSSRSSTWGWITKKSDWSSIQWDNIDYFKSLLNNSEFLEKLAIAGNDRERLLKNYVDKSLNIWGIRRGAWQVDNNKFTLYPKHSLLYNIGLDGSGVNCGIRDDAKINFKEDFMPTQYLKNLNLSKYTETKIKKFYDVKGL